MTSIQYLHYKCYPIRSQCTLLYPLKTSENLTVFRCFQGIEKRCIGNEWVNEIWTFLTPLLLTNNIAMLAEVLELFLFTKTAVRTYSRD